VALRALPERPEVLIANATGRDHPRRAGLALHLGAVLDIPSIGVTDHPLTAEGLEPGPERGATSPLLAECNEVARLVRTRAGARPLVVHPGWRTDLETAVSVVLGSVRRARTPEPLRRARREARRARASDEAAGGRAGRLVADLYAFYVEHHRRRYSWDGAPVHDAVAMAHVIDGTLLETKHCGVRVDTGSELSRGRTYVDLWGVTGWAPNCHVAVDIDSERFLELLIERIASLG